MQMFRQFGAIAKIEEQKDGTIKVYGIASSGGRDSAGEIVMPDAMKAALPDYGRFPALREMHQPLAAGRVLEAEVDGDGTTNIVAHVVDPVAVTKVKTGVYSGFSIGGKVTSRDPTDRSTITGLRLVEISLVDSPCNPDAILSMWKADMTFTPTSESVVARAKELAAAKADGLRKAKFSEFLFEAREELISEHLLEKGDNDAELPAPIVEAPAVETPVVEAETAETVEVVEAAATAKPVSAEEEGDGDSEDGTDGDDGDEDDAADPQAKKVDPAAAISAALEKGNAAMAAVEPEPVAEAVSPFDDLAKVSIALKGIGSESPLLAKSLWHVERFADILDDYACLHAAVKMEAMREGDGSPIAAQIMDQIKAMGDTLIAMAQEEVAEVVSELTTDEGAECVIVYCGDEMAMAEQIVDLVKADAELMEKAGARHSKRDAEYLQKAHDSLMKMGAMCDKNNCEKDDMAMAAEAEQLSELTSENERLTKALADAAPAVEELVTKFTGTIDTLQAEVGELRKRFDAEPLPTKTAGPAAIGTPVSKGADSAGSADTGLPAPAMTDDQFQKAWESLPEGERGQILLKMALQRPQPLLPQ